MAAAGALAIALLLVSAAGASASSSHRYWTSFGNGLIAYESHITVDNSNGSSAHDVYVSDTWRNRVLKFGPDGKFILMFGGEVDATTGGDVCTAASGDRCREAGVPPPIELPEDASAPGLYYPADLAVDGSGGQTAGEVYVVDDAQGGRVLRFRSDGSRDLLWADEGEMRMPGAAGVAVDANGRLLVLDLAGETDLVRTYDPNGTELGSVAVPWGGYPIDLEVDGAGNLYVPASNSEIVEVDADGTRVRGFAVRPGSANGFAVDGAGGGVFISRGEEIARFSAGCLGDPCSPAEAFGERDVWAGDLAIDEADQTLYAIDLGLGVSVAVFLPADRIPEVTTGSANVLGENTADLTGRVDPVGSPAAISCRFEYVTEAAFDGSGFADARSTPCRQSTPISTQREVSARISGLERGTSYRFRLVVETVDKTVAGFDERFDTPILSRAQTGPVLGVGTESALLSGSVKSAAPRPILKCEFEVVSGSVFARAGFTAPLLFPCDPGPFYRDDEVIDVTGQATFLQPGSTYSYRIVATNSDGVVPGAAVSFTTLPQPREPEPKIERPHHGRRHQPRHKVRCSRKACTRLLEGSPHARVWVSPRFPRSYGWLFEIYVDGHPLHHTSLERGCRSIFAGHGVIARLNACHGRFRIVYRGSGSMRIRWRVFARCRCAESARIRAPGI